MPSVIVYISTKRHKFKTIRYSKRNIWIRDEGCCQYCDTFIPKEYTVDHVIPRTKGGKTVFDNVVLSCFKCNQKKGDKTPREANLVLKKIPVKPSYLPYTSEFTLKQKIIHPSWKIWLGNEST